MLGSPLAFINIFTILRWMLVVLIDLDPQAYKFTKIAQDRGMVFWGVPNGLNLKTFTKMPPTYSSNSKTNYLKELELLDKTFKSIQISLALTTVLSPETGTRVPKAQAAGAPARRQLLEREANVTTPSLSSLQAGSSPALWGFLFSSSRGVSIS